MNAKRNSTSFTLILICLLSVASFLQGQDIHYTMFDRSPMNINPGLTGIFGGDLRVTANYRSQWNNVPVSFQTFTATLEHKFYPKNNENGFWTGGLYFNYDDAGDLTVATTQIGLSGAYAHALSEQHHLSGGIQLGFNQRRFDTQSLRTDVQFNGDTFDPTTPNGEALLNDNISFGDISAGINYRFQNIDEEDNKRTRLDLGLALYHINAPNKGFDDEVDSDLDRRLVLYGISAFAITRKLDLGLSGSFQFQGPFEEFIVGVNARRYFKEQKALSLGLAYRIGDNDAIAFPVITLDISNFSFGFSYDWNTSDFDVATNNFGGPEFSVIYTAGKPRKAIERPCLIF